MNKHQKQIEHEKKYLRRALIGFLLALFCIAVAHFIHLDLAWKGAEFLIATVIDLLFYTGLE